MTAWGVVAVCAIGGGVAGPLLEQVSRRVVRPTVAPAGAAVAPAGGFPVEAPTGAPVGSAVPVAALISTPAPAPARVGEVVLATLVTAASCALAALRLGTVPSLAAYCALFGGLAAVSLVDLRIGLVPRRLLYPTLGVVTLGLVAASADVGAWHPLLDALIGGAVAFAVFYAIWWIYPKGMGFGDVRLAGLCGLALGFLGFPPLYIGFLAAFLFGALGGVVALALRGARKFPFAPALAAGTAFGVLWGAWLGNLWLHPG